jgi:intracellular sulfur oxidation DsrE/DsrF family protein
MRVRAAFLTIGSVVAMAVATTAFTASRPRPDNWLSNLKAEHRQLFDAPAPLGGIPLVHVMNYYDTYNKAFNVPDKHINGVLTLYGSTVFHGLSDSMWSKYQLGTFLGEKDAAGVGYVANPWRATPNILGSAMPAASIESLQKRGVTFIMCNNALTIFAGMVAQARGLDAKGVLDDMKAHILPGVTVVPAMVIAIEQAQKAGISYHRQ